MSSGVASTAEEAEYHSSDFEWEELRQEVEGDPSLSYHLAPFPCRPLSSSSTSSLESDAWRSFHRRHSTGKFFKERRYLLKEFLELVSSGGDSARLLEVGCGNGSTVLPILRARQSITIYGCDCSEDVLEKAKEIIASAKGPPFKDRFHPFLLDFSLMEFPEWLFCRLCRSSCGKSLGFTRDANQENKKTFNPSFLGDNQCCIGGVHFITLIFSLSAIPFNKMSTIIDKCVSVLKAGGLILFRDYGLYDMTMLRFLPDQRVGFREYLRSDGTNSYFFSLDVVRNLFCAAGLVKVELQYCCIRSLNRRNGKRMNRVWVHGKFQKPMS